MPILATLTITMDDAGNVSATGPIDNKMLCYGLLEITKEIVRKHIEDMQRRIQPAMPGDLAKLAELTGDKKPS